MHLDHFIDFWELSDVQFRPAAYGGGEWTAAEHLPSGIWCSHIIEDDAYGAIVVAKALATLDLSLTLFSGWGPHPTYRAITGSSLSESINIRSTAMQGACYLNLIQRFELTVGRSVKEFP